MNERETSGGRAARSAMGTTRNSAAASLCRSRTTPPTIRCLLSLPAFLSLAILLLLLLLCLHTVVVDVVSRTKTIAGHNLEPTPWHPFPSDLLPASSGGGWAYARASRILRCSYLSCSRTPLIASTRPLSSSQPSSCPDFFRWIHRDLAPWRKSRISESMLAEARTHAAMRIVIMGGRRLYVDLYYACVQSRAMFTIWGLLQLLRRYPGMLPDVDLMFDCMDRPAINRSQYDNGGGQPPPPPLFRYCTTREHFDIPFPDWSFWGWPEINIEPWDQEFRSIKLGSQATTWRMKGRSAYWKGNPDVQSPIRMALLSCNDTKKWGAQIMRQDWAEESSSGFQNSKLSSQCNHSYKIYAEGYAWSVSLKYILACGSLALIIDPQYEDFFTRGLVPRLNYWPISPTNLCDSIKSTVDWGNKHPSKAEAIGKRGQAFMQDLDMARVYDYMYHLIVEYSKLQDFKPTPPSSAQEVCPESLLCFADQKQRHFLEESCASPSSSPPCSLPPPDHDPSKGS